MKQTPEPVLLQVAALYRHWCRADAIKYVLFAAKTGEPRDRRVEEAEAISSSFRLEVFYALTYVVVEGYRELQLQDPLVDQLLAIAPYVDQLRRFRNGVFHYQTDPFGDKLMDFMTAAQSEEWLRDLHLAFQQLFLRTLPIEAKLKEIGWDPVKM